MKKVHLAALTLLVSMLLTHQVYAQNIDEPDEDEGSTSLTDQTLIDQVEKFEHEDDGDDDLPEKIKKPKIHPKILSAYGAKEVLRFKLNKDSFIDSYFDQGLASQDSPYKAPTSKFTGGAIGNYKWKDFTFTGGIDIKRNYSGSFSDWDGLIDKTYFLGAAYKIKLSNKWSVTPSLKQTSVVSDQKTKELRKTNVSLPFSYALDKFWTVKALTLGYATQTYTGRPLEQTDRTWTVSSGVSYKWSEKSTLAVSVSREQRYSNQASAEYTKTSIIPAYEYKFSPTSSASFGLGYETHATSIEQYSRWLLAPKVLIRWDM